MVVPIWLDLTGRGMVVELYLLNPIKTCNNFEFADQWLDNNYTDHEHWTSLIAKAEIEIVHRPKTSRCQIYIR